MEDKEFVCCICGKTFKGFGNNPYPLCHRDDYESRCCNVCDNYVIAARIDKMYKHMTDEMVQKKYLGRVCEKNGN